MPHDSTKTKAQKAKKPTKSPTGTASKAKSSASNNATPKSTKRAQSSSAEGRKRGNKGNFHGASLAYLESWLPAYIEAPGKKGSFWDEFFKGWGKAFPPLNDGDGDGDGAGSATAAEAPSAVQRSEVETSSSTAEGTSRATPAEASAAAGGTAETRVEPTNQATAAVESLDPHTLFARTVGKDMSNNGNL